MSDEEVRDGQDQADQPAEGGAEKKDRWDELMAKLDAITETLRNACDGDTEGSQSPEQSDGESGPKDGESQEEGQAQSEETQNQQQG